MSALNSSITTDSTREVVPPAELTSEQTMLNSVVISTSPPSPLFPSPSTIPTTRQQTPLVTPQEDLSPSDHILTPVVASLCISNKGVPLELLSRVGQPSELSLPGHATNEPPSYSAVLNHTSQLPDHTSLSEVEQMPAPAFCAHPQIQTVQSARHHALEDVELLPGYLITVAGSEPEYFIPTSESTTYTVQASLSPFSHRSVPSPTLSIAPVWDQWTLEYLVDDEIMYLMYLNDPLLRESALRAETAIAQPLSNLEPTTPSTRPSRAIAASTVQPDVDQSPVDTSHLRGMPPDLRSSSRRFALQTHQQSLQPTMATRGHGLWTREAFVRETGLRHFQQIQTNRGRPTPQSTSGRLEAGALTTTERQPTELLTVVVVNQTDSRQEASDGPTLELQEMVLVPPNGDFGSTSEEGSALVDHGQTTSVGSSAHPQIAARRELFSTAPRRPSESTSGDIAAIPEATDTQGSDPVGLDGSGVWPLTKDFCSMPSYALVQAYDPLTWLWWATHDTSSLQKCRQEGHSENVLMWWRKRMGASGNKKSSQIPENPNLQVEISVRIRGLYYCWREMDTVEEMVTSLRRLWVRRFTFSRDDALLNGQRVSGGAVAEVWIWQEQAAVDRMAFLDGQGAQSPSFSSSLKTRHCRVRVLHGLHAEVETFILSTAPRLPELYALDTDSVLKGPTRANFLMSISILSLLIAVFSVATVLRGKMG